MNYTEEELRMQMLAGIITEGQFRDMVSKIGNKAKKIAVGGAMAAAICLPSCKKEGYKVIYKYSYQTQQDIDNAEKGDPNRRATQFIVSGHELSDAEFAALKKDLDDGDNDGDLSPDDAYGKDKFDTKLELDHIDVKDEW